jgi:hypothetical protein
MHLSRLAGLLALFSSAAFAVPLRYTEGSLVAFPTLTELDGTPRAKGRLTQWVARDGLHVKGTFTFSDGRVVEENAVLTQNGGELKQRSWSWRLARKNTVEQSYSLDFASGEARAFKIEDGKPREWTKTLTIQPGKTFAGIGFMIAVKNLREGLVNGETYQLEGLGFTPGPRLGKVTVRSVGIDTLKAGGRSLTADHVVIHPEVPKIAKLFVHIGDNHVWFYRSRPPGFLRSEGPMMELGTYRIEALGPPSSAARARRRAPPQ